MAANPALEARTREASRTPTSFSPETIRQVSQALNVALADTLALYLKTKSFHWHVSGPHFRDYHLLFDGQAAQMLAATEGIAERVRKIGGSTLKSIGHVAKLQRVRDNDAGFVSAGDMLRELMEDNRTLLDSLRSAHAAASEHADVATTGLLESWIDEAEERIWFLFETSCTPSH